LKFKQLKTSVLFFFLFGCSFNTIKAQVDKLQSVVEELAASSDFKNSMVAISVYDTKSAEKLYGFNDQYVVSIASTTKIFSTAAALSILGDKRLETRIYFDGEIKDSILNGNIWIRGGGDPTLGSKYITYKNGDSTSTFLYTWCDAIRAKGIKKINGKIIGDASEFGYKGCPDGWSWSDIGNAYGAYPSGLCIFDNVVNFNFQTGESGQAATLINMIPYVPNLKFYNYITSSSSHGDNSYIYGAPFQNERIGTGTLQKSTRITTRGSLPNPEFQVAYELMKKLNEVGIAVSDSVICARDLQINKGLSETRYETLSLLYTYKGGSISEIIQLTNKHSINMFADQLVCLIGYYKNGDGSHDNGVSYLNSFWKKTVGLSGSFLTDGSGLSRSNAISTEYLCAVLNHMSKSRNYTTFYNSLPISGVSGTLSDFCKGQAAQGKVHAKSGTMNRIKSYAGYVTTNTGKQLTFAVVLNNYNCSNNQAKVKLEKIMNVLVTLP
jgi:D-alanyl-D-alanine carboxypeptidase/D-alanyl-D-alanine-endopeptidase (penicillin-binding protein 4)